MNRLQRLLLFVAWCTAAARGDTVVYQNGFDGPLGATYPEWSSTGYTWSGNGRTGSGLQAITNVDSPNRAQRFLGEFGGAAVVAAPPFVRVDTTVTLTLKNLAPHSALKLAFDLYVLKSWDGTNPTYGPDRWSVALDGGPVLLATTFSNNPKTGADFSPQDYPEPASAFQSGAARVNTLGYNFYGDAIYRLTFTFAHRGETLVLHFSSSLFEGKGARDESWGLDNVIVSVPDASVVLPKSIGPERR